MILWSDYQLSEWMCLFDLKRQERNEKDSQVSVQRRREPVTHSLSLWSSHLSCWGGTNTGSCSAFLLQDLTCNLTQFFCNKKLLVPLLLWYTRDEEVNVMGIISVSGRSNYELFVIIAISLIDWILNTRQPNWSSFFKQAMHHNQVDWEPSSNDHEQKSRATAPCLFAGDEITKL